MSRDLTRTLRLGDLVLVVIGTVIGSGIWVVPGAVLRASGGDYAVRLKNGLELSLSRSRRAALEAKLGL